MYETKNEKRFKVRGSIIAGICTIIAAVITILYSKNDSHSTVVIPVPTFIKEVQTSTQSNPGRRPDRNAGAIIPHLDQPISASETEKEDVKPIEPPVPLHSFVNQMTRADIAVSIVHSTGEYNSPINAAIISLYRNIGMSGTSSLFTPSFYQSGYFNELYGVSHQLLNNLGVDDLVKYIAVGKYAIEFEEGQYMKYVCRARLEMVLISTKNLQEVNRFTITVSGSHEDKYHAEAAAIEKLSDNYQHNHLKIGL